MNDNDYYAQLEEFKIKFTNRGYKENEIIEQFNKATEQDRDKLLTYKTKQNSNKIVFSTKYNQNLPNIGQHIQENWHLLHINPVISESFQENPVVAYKRNPNLKQLIGQHRLSNGKVIKKRNNSMGKCRPCRSKRGNKCCKQVKETTTFSNRHTGQEFKIFQKLTCKSKNIIYLIECIKFNNKAYIGKTEIAANERINGHRSDAKNNDSILVDRHFLQPGHNFNLHAKFTLIEQVTKTDLSGEELTTLLEKREDFWMMKLQTLVLNGFNTELNFSQ